MKKHKSAHRIAFGNDHAASGIRTRLVKGLRAAGHTVRDFGYAGAGSVDYPDIAFKVARKVASGTCDRGILVCGTGVGMSIAANKIPGVRAAVCWDNTVAALVAAHNNANILCLPARFSTPAQMLRWVNTWLATPYGAEPRHLRRVDKITRWENVHRAGAR
jgi:ribose 5-phosphate isomerase B